MIYIIVSLLLTVVGALAYSLGYDKGKEAGVDQVLNEDLARLNTSTPMVDEGTSAMIDNLMTDTPDESLELQQNIIAACEMAEKGETI
jgi:hypothetical protein